MVSAQLPYLSFSRYGGTYYNPADMGKNGAGDLFLLTHAQWLAFKHAPITGYFSLSGELTSSGAVLGGISYLFDKVGPFQEHVMGMDIAYRFVLHQSHFKDPITLTFGIKPIFSLTAYDISAVSRTDSETTAKQKASEGTFQLGAGLRLSYHYGDFSASLLPGKQIPISGTVAKYNYPFTFMASTSVNLLKSEHFYIIPKVTVFYSPLALITVADLAFTGEKAWTLGFRGKTPRQLGAYLILHFPSQNQHRRGGNVTAFRLGYSYEVRVNEYSGLLGIHELMLSYVLKYRKLKFNCLL